jgi:hypothetical protein
MATIQLSNLTVGFEPIAIAVMALKQNSAKRLFT